MILIPKSSFVRIDNKSNKQIVNLSEFKISKYLITVKDWKEFLISQALDFEFWEQSLIRSLDNWSIEETNPNWPAWNISWIEAIRFCNWLSLKENLIPCYDISRENYEYKVTINNKANGYCLPTVAQWQLVSRFYSSEVSYETILAQEVLTDNNSNLLPKEVGTKQPNFFGIYDILGNMQEFCWDYYYENEEWLGTVENPMGPKTFTPNPDQVYFNEPLSDTHVVTKGMWATKLKFILDNPFTFATSIEKDFIGFRIVKNN